LTNDIKIVKAVDTKQAEKKLIIESADAVIKKFAMMVELLATTIASKAVIAAALHIAVTQNTESKLIRFEPAH